MITPGASEPPNRRLRPGAPAPRLWTSSLRYYWRTNLAMVAGVAIAVAVLAGALLVGESVRGSLRELLSRRLGAASFVVSTDRFFGEDLAGRLAARLRVDPATQVCPIVMTTGVVQLERTRARAYGVDVYGVDDRFWRFHGQADPSAPGTSAAAVGSGLADALGYREGDHLLLSVEGRVDAPRESAFGRREGVGAAVRLEGGRIVPSARLGEFSLHADQGTVKAVFVPLRRLQRALGEPGGANALLLTSSAAGDADRIGDALRAAATLADTGVTLRPLPDIGGVAVESRRVIIDDALAAAAARAAADLDAEASGVFSYLANAIRVRGRDIPYSVIAAVEGVSPPPRPGAGDDEEPIWLNQWAWDDLQGAEGDAVEVDYYRWLDEGRLVTRTARFRLRGVVPYALAIDETFAPSFPGITGAGNIRAWDPPFPLDLGRIRPRDEDYWKRYRATPKAVVGLAAGQRLWSSRFGGLSSVRIGGAPPDRVAEAVRRHVDPGQAGFTVSAVRQRGLEAARGSTDFGAYFLYFSAFLVGAALLLAALFFRLGIEQRQGEVGTLLAVGIAPREVGRLFLREGALLSLAGAGLGTIGALAYGGAMMAGLRTWWIGAVGTRELSLHLSASALALGAAAGVLVSLATVVRALSGLRRFSARALLAGVMDTTVAGPRGARSVVTLAAASLGAAALLALAAWRNAVPASGAFFGAGALVLTSAMCAIAAALRRGGARLVGGSGWPALARLGARNTAARPGRSLLCIALVASATFIVVSVEAFRKNEPGIEGDPQGGTGGYALVARSSVPIAVDPEGTAGREALGIPRSDVPELAPVEFVPFRVSDGDDASCANLYAPVEPRVIGASPGFVAAGRFSFQSSLAATAEERRNPWRLLEAAPRDGAVPAIGDANTIEYVLHRSLGDEISVRGSHGATVRLRLVGALRDSILQGELVVSDRQFRLAFPDVEGFRFFLLGVPPASASSLVAPLQERLQDWGFAVSRSSELLAGYHRVENTYLSTFQALGGLGLVLGTFGLGAVLLRNVLERRPQFALLRAVGYGRGAIAFIIVWENVLLTSAGLVCGTLAAAVATAPALHARGASYSAGMVAALLAAVMAAGVLSSLAAVGAAVGAPLIRALRSE